MYMENYCVMSKMFIKVQGNGIRAAADTPCMSSHSLKNGIHNFFRGMAHRFGLAGPWAEVIAPDVDGNKAAALVLLHSLQQVLL